jgi:hypothetical protein
MRGYKWIADEIERLDPAVDYEEISGNSQRATTSTTS